jgi:hypothetical protein
VPVLASSTAQAACNLIPGTAKTFNAALGATNRPFAAPGEPLEIMLRSCDPPSARVAASPADHVVTVIFKPPDGSARNAVVLTADEDCTAVAPALTACEAALSGGSATCVAGAAAGVFTAERNDGRHLGFRFPNTDDLLGVPGDSLTLAGPATIAVTARGAPLPCGLASASCTGQTGLVACIDDLFANDGSCGTAVPHGTFPHFTALPLPNAYRTNCFSEAPPCNGMSTEARFALDSAGNLLMPVAWGGVLVRQGTAPAARLIRVNLRPPLPLALPDQVFLGSFTPEGGRLATIFEPQFDPTVADPDTVTFFGKTDAPYTVLRLARRHGTCDGGGNDGARCAEYADCPGGLCVPSCVGAPATPCESNADCGVDGPCGQLFDFSSLAVGGGLVVVPRPSTQGICQSAPHESCTGDGDCPGIDNPCVSYALEAQTPAPLEGLQQALGINAFTIDEGIGMRDRNGDGDIYDSVVTLRDRTTGAGEALGAPAGCGIAGTPEGRAVVRVSEPPFSFPAVAVEGDVEAFIESESAENYCIENGDGDRFDGILRVFRLGTGEVSTSLSPLRAVDAMPVVDGRPLVVSAGRVFYRRSETAEAKQLTTRVNVGPGGVQVSGNDISSPTLSPDGRFVGFASCDPDFLGPGGDTNGFCDAFIRDLQTGVNGRGESRRMATPRSRKGPPPSWWGPRSRRTDGLWRFQVLPPISSDLVTTRTGR